jgi:hypothetical protein
MFWRYGNLRLATAVLVLITIGSHGFATVYTATEQCFGSAVAASDTGCDTTKNCCCGDAPVQACGCPINDHPAESPMPVVPEDNLRLLKWAAGQFSLAFEISPTLDHEACSSIDRLDISPSERSIQSRLCNWRC